MDAFHYDTNGDGWNDLTAWDTNGDNVLDTYQWDTNQDGVNETFGWDTNFDGVLDTYDSDLNENGYFDSTESSQTYSSQTDIWLNGMDNSQPSSGEVWSGYADTPIDSNFGTVNGYGVYDNQVAYDLTSSVTATLGGYEYVYVSSPW